MQQGKNGWLPDGIPPLMMIGYKIFYHNYARVWLSATQYFTTIVNLATMLCHGYYEILHAIGPIGTQKVMQHGRKKKNALSELQRDFGPPRELGGVHGIPAMLEKVRDLRETCYKRHKSP